MPGISEKPGIGKQIEINRLNPKCRVCRVLLADLSQFADIPPAE
jgi:hypothetical protein